MKVETLAFLMHQFETKLKDHFMDPLPRLTNHAALLLGPCQVD